MDPIEAKPEIREETETVTVVRGLPLRLSLDPDAILQHFEGHEGEDQLAELTREQLLEIGEAVLTGDTLYDAFNRALRDEIRERHGFDPETGETDEDEEDE